MGTKKFSKLVLSLIILIGLLLINSWTYASDTIKIAALLPTSGAFAAMGTQSIRHLELAADHINSKGGCLGKKLEVLSFDNKNNAGESLFQLKRAIDQGITFIFQTHSSGVTVALSDAILKHNDRNPDKRLIFLCPDATDPILCDEKCNFWFFRFGSDANQKLKALVKYLALRKDMKNVFLINMDYSHGRGISAASHAELGKQRPDVKIVGETFHAVGKIKDFSPYINSVKTSGADTVVTGDWGPDLELLIKASYDAGLKVQWATVYAGGLGTPSALQESGLGTLQVSTWHMNVNDGKNATTEFAIQYIKKYGMDMMYQEINTLVAMLCAAIEKTKSLDPFSIALALEGMKFNTPTGEVQMRADNHQIVSPLYVSRFSRNTKYTVEGTKFGWETVMQVEPKDLYLPTTCKMERPGK
jgi:branched-chain amino acid transport system substrate-binding protein